MKYLVFLLSLIASFGAYAQYGQTFGDMKNADRYIKLAESDIHLKVVKGSQNIKSKVVKNSLSWIRYEDTLLLPRVLTKIESSIEASRLRVNYQGVDHFFQQDQNTATALFYGSPYEGEKVYLYLDGKLTSELEFDLPKNRESLIVDYSCYPYDLDVSGMNNERLSVGCKESITGGIGSEEVTLQVLFSSPSFRPVGSGSGRKLINLRENNSAVIALINDVGEKRKLVIKARVPKRRKRLGFALGFGPYHYVSKYQDHTFDNSTSFMYMLYGRFTLTQEHSFKLFDAFIKQKSTFNNLGLYFSSDIAKIWDNRLVFNTLIGLQELYYETPDLKQHKIIYPQGLEMTFNHPFDLKNYKLMFGGFVSPDASLDYNNIWIRFGKRVFYELNYIKWNSEGSHSESFGLSVGIPLFSIF